jgi:hypothetical protein
MPNSRFRTLPDAAHFPNLEDPEGLAAALLEFIAETEPAPAEALADWGAVLEGRSPRTRRGEGALA